MLQKRTQLQNGYATNDFILPDGVQGGEYTLVVNGLLGTVEKTIVVSNYEPPRIKKKLEFVRKGYGPGDEVNATVVIKRPTGEPLAGKTLRARIRLDGEDLEEVKVKTDENGGAMVRVRLPKKIEVGDGLLTVLVDDGGITESVPKRVPIVVKKLRLTMFPEGGQPVAGLEGPHLFRG